MIARIGNSNNGPITNVKAIKGWSGNAVIAIAKAIGEFPAKVTKLKLTLSESHNLSKLLTYKKILQ